MPQAKKGQVWQDAYNQTPGSEYAKSPPTLTITETDGKPGGFAHGVRQPSGRRTRVRLDEQGGVRGYVLLKDV